MECANRTEHFLKNHSLCKFERLKIPEEGDTLLLISTQWTYVDMF